MEVHDTEMIPAKSGGILNATEKLQDGGGFPGILRSREAYANHMQIRCQPTPALRCAWAAFCCREGPVCFNKGERDVSW